MKPQNKITIAIDLLSYVGFGTAYKLGGKRGAALYTLGFAFGGANFIANDITRMFLRSSALPDESSGSSQN